MTGRQYDAIVIGGGISGLIAATYAARAGMRVLLLEARTVMGGLCEPVTDGGLSVAGAQTLFAVDPNVLEDLRLPLKFAVRDMPLVSLRPDGRHLVIGRDVHATARSLMPTSPIDAETWPRFRRLLFAQARAMRALWWPAEAAADLSVVNGRNRAVLESMKFAGAAAWLGSWFESEPLKAALSFDATEDGAAVNAPPSALMLLWRAAQEMCGLHGAVAFPRGGLGALADMLIRTAQTAGAEVRTNAAVAHLFVDAARVRGAALDTGEAFEAPIVLSTLSRHATQAIAPAGVFGLGAPKVPAPATGSARLTLLFDRPANFGNAPRIARFVFADRVESHLQAHDTALAGQIADEPVFEAVTSADLPNVLSLLVRPVPVAPARGWRVERDVLTAKALAALSAHDRTLGGALRSVSVLAPADLDERFGVQHTPATVARLLAPARLHVTTPVEGLLLCGGGAEPVSAICGRAARLAASIAVSQWKPRRKEAMA